MKDWTSQFFDSPRHNLNNIVTKELQRRAQATLKLIDRKLEARQGKPITIGDCFLPATLSEASKIVLQVVTLWHRDDDSIVFVVPIVERCHVRNREVQQYAFTVFAQGWGNNLLALPTCGEWVHVSELGELVDCHPIIGERAACILSSLTPPPITNIPSD